MTMVPKLTNFISPKMTNFRCALPGTVFTLENVSGHILVSNYETFSSAIFKKDTFQKWAKAEHIQPKIQQLCRYLRYRTLALKCSPQNLNQDGHIFNQLDLLGHILNFKIL